MVTDLERIIQNKLVQEQQTQGSGLLVIVQGPDGRQEQMPVEIAQLRMLQSIQEMLGAIGREVLIANQAQGFSPYIEEVVGGSDGSESIEATGPSVPLDSVGQVPDIAASGDSQLPDDEAGEATD